MELSGILQHYGVPLTKAERALFSGLNTAGSTRPDAYYEQQIKRLADARQALKQLPDKKTSDRQAKLEKMKLLKERLKMLKQMIPFMSAAAAKSLKAELKQIAQQIASLKGEAGGVSPADGVGRDSATAQSASAEADVAADTADTAESAEATTGAAAGRDQANALQVPKDDQPTAAERAADFKAQAATIKAENAAERAEEEELEKLRQLYQAVRQMLERKLQKPNDPATQAALQMQAYQAAADALSSTSVSIKG